jgi:putative hydroxymethylpyrimidine transport system substrate-binding protein
VIRRLAPVLACLGAVLALAACGEKQESATVTGGADRLTLELDYLPNADHAGIYTAQASGAFQRAGLDVRLQVPSDPSAPLKLLAAGKVDLAISYEPELLLARDKGLDLVAVAALVQRPLTSIMGLPSGHVRTPADLEGKTIGTAGIPYQSAYLKTILAKAGADPAKVKEVNVGFNLVPAMLSKKVDATLGAYWNVEGIELARRNKQPQIIRMETAGLPTYDELVVVARRQDVEKRGAVLRRFVQALARGHQALRDDPAAGADALVKANPDLDRDTQLAQIQATLPVFFPAGGKPFGYMVPSEWRAYGQWMADNRLVKQLPTTAAMTNEYLPGQGI